MNHSDLGNYAYDLLNNPAWEHAYSVLEGRLTSQWKNSAVDDWKSRERVFAQLQALMDVKQQLETFLAEGQFARKP